MRKRYRVLMLAAMAAALAVPFGFALSLESAPEVATTAAAVATTTTAALSVPTAHPPVDTSAQELHPMPDAAKLMLVGSILFGLAAAVRKGM